MEKSANVMINEPVFLSSIDMQYRMLVLSKKNFEYEFPRLNNTINKVGNTDTCNKNTSFTLKRKK